MRMILPEETIWRENTSLLYALGIRKKESPVISVVGAGGKTSTIEYLAGEYSADNHKVIVTTTTHMYQPQQTKWCREENLELVEEFLKKQNEVWIGLPFGEDKISSPSRMFLEQLVKKKIPLLIEADGARQLPFKIPGEHEPVLLKMSNLVIGVLGLDAIGTSIKETCFRPQSVAEFLDKTEESILTEEDYVKVAQSCHGLKKGVTDNMKYVVILNKADTKKRTEQAIRIRDMLIAHNINVFITSHKYQEERSCL